MPVSRRHFLNIAAMGAVAGTPFRIARAADPVVDSPATAAPGLIGGFRLGCQAWSFSRYSAFEAIEKTAQAGAAQIEFYPNQKLRSESRGSDQEVGPGLSPDNLTQLKEKLAQTGVRAVAFGMQRLGRDEAANRRIFDFARSLSLETIVSEPDVDSMDDIEKLVREYDIKLAIHNHPRRPKDANYHYWDPQYVLSLVQDRDPRIGSCADTGHWMRSGIKPVDALKLLKGRVLHSHLKDLNALAPSAHDVPYGSGVADMPAILSELKDQSFTGNISIEYEYHWETSLPEIAQCIGFVRGWGAASSMSKAA